MIESPVITIGLMWHSIKSDNLGIGALTVSHIAIIDRIACETGTKICYKILGWQSGSSVDIQNNTIEFVQLRGRDIIRFGGLYSEVRGCDLVFDISAGDSFADIYGSRRFIFNVLAKLVILIARRPLILSPQTVGPFERWWALKIAHILTRAADKVVTRDRLSTEFLQDFKLGSKLFEATDVAFRLAYDAPPPRSVLPRRVGINVSGLLFNGGYSRDNMFSVAADYPAFVRGLIKYFSNLPDCEVHLISHVISENHVVEDDYRVTQKLASEFPSVILAPRFEDPSHAKSYIATMDFFCGSRMHACIAAFSSGVPVLPVAYSRKFAGLFGTLGYNHIADCRSQSTDEILAVVIDAFEQRDALKTEVETGCQAVEEKLTVYEAVLRDCLLEALCLRK